MDPFGTLWGSLGPPWGPLVIPLAALGTLWGSLRGLWGSSGCLFALFGDPLDPLGVLLRDFDTPLEPFAWFYIPQGSRFGTLLGAFGSL